MRRRNPIDLFFDQLERELLEGPMGPWNEESMKRTLSEGRRVERVDGETREYYLNDDGEWVEVDDDGDLFDFDETENGYRMTADLSAYLPTGSFEASATVNNGVLDIEFESSNE